MKKCLTIGCEGNYYAKGYCRKCYRKITGEGKKRYSTIKNSDYLMEKLRNSKKKWYGKNKDTDKYKEVMKKKWSNWYSKNKENFKDYVKEWRKNLPEEKRQEYSKKDNATRHFGSWRKREEVIIRDGEKCTRCGVNRIEHIKKWHQDLHVDHKDNYGRNVQKDFKHNSLDNLITLCIRCHRSKSSKEQWDSNREKLLLYGKEFTKELQEEVRKRDDHTCRDCYVSQDKLNRKLDVHHVDGDKRNNKIENLLSLCARCHNKRESQLTHRDI